MIGLYLAWCYGWVIRAACHLIGIPAMWLAEIATYVDDYTHDVQLYAMERIKGRYK